MTFPPFSRNFPSFFHQPWLKHPFHHLSIHHWIHHQLRNGAMATLCFRVALPAAPGWPRRSRGTSQSWKAWRRRRRRRGWMAWGLRRLAAPVAPGMAVVAAEAVGWSCWLLAWEMIREMSWLSWWWSWVRLTWWLSWLSWWWSSAGKLVKPWWN